MRKGFKLAIIIWLIILSIISIVALCRSFHRDVDLGIDYIGIIVGILAALCAVLIGWQIFSIIDFDKKKNELKKAEERLRESLREQAVLTENRIRSEREEARLNTAYLGHLFLMIINKKRDKIVLDSFNRINGIKKSTELIRQMSYQALKGTLPQVLKSQEDFYLVLKDFQRLHFDTVCKMALEEYSLTQDESNNHILELVNELKHQCFP